MKRPEFTNDDDAFHAFNDLMAAVGHDREGAHLEGDGFVWDLLEQNGFPKLAAALRKSAMGWWYS